MKKAAGIWERHAERMRRQAQLEHFNQWCLDHPWKARALALGIAIAVAEIALFVRYGLDALARTNGQ